MGNYFRHQKSPRQPAKTFTAFFSIGLFLLFFWVFVNNSQAAATSTLRGLAWWGDTYQYVSFSCLDDIIGDRLDTPENLYNEPEPRGFHFYSAPCSSLVHGVEIDANNNFSGEAWNPTMELISFNATATPPSYAFNVHCPTCTFANSCSACYDEAEQKIYGWARVLKDDTWIRLDSSYPAPTEPVKLQSWDVVNNPVLPGRDIAAGDFIGTASSDLGPLSFNCETEDEGESNCATRDYKVYISNLQIGYSSAPNWTYSQACTGPARSAILRWYKRSSQQSAYEVVVNNVETLSTSTAVCWSGKIDSSSATQYILPNADPTCGSLAYNTNYYWWVRLYDDEGTPTEWYQYTTNSSSDTDGNPDSNPKTFTTYKHEFPSPYFDWTPLEVTVGSTTRFISDSHYYSSALPSTSQNCNGIQCFYLWTTSDTGALISNPTSSQTNIIFLRATGTTVTLRLTDVDSYVCSAASLIQINYGLPIWHEVKAEELN